MHRPAFPAFSAAMDLSLARQLQAAAGGAWD